MRWFLWSIALGLALFCNTASAFEVKPTAVSISLASYHFDRSTDHNETNPGVFLELNYDFVVGVYRNSLSRTTVLTGYQFRFGMFEGVRFGGMAALCTGYSIPVCGMFTLGYGPITLGFIPPVTSKAGVIGLSVGMSL
jgi:hypothetical protein